MFYKMKIEEKKMSTILKCKMCGGDIEVSKDMSVGTCSYLGSLVLPLR